MSRLFLCQNLRDVRHAVVGQFDELVVQQSVHVARLLDLAQQLAHAGAVRERALVLMRVRAQLRLDNAVPVRKTEFELIVRL
jgi:hypothetical protein